MSFEVEEARLISLFLFSLVTNDHRYSVFQYKHNAYSAPARTSERLDRAHHDRDSVAPCRCR